MNSPSELPLCRHTPLQPHHYYRPLSRALAPQHEKSRLSSYLPLFPSLPLLISRGQCPRHRHNHLTTTAATAMASSPTKQSIPAIPPSKSTPPLDAPPSPRSHRALRRLQSAHALGQQPSGQPSLIAQHHRQALQRNLSPAKRDAPARARANSDAPSLPSPAPASAGRRPVAVRRPAAEALSLDRLVRDGPPDGDLPGGLEATRLKILDQGVKSDGDGMVGLHSPQLTTLANTPSPPSASTSGSSSSMPPSSRPTPTSRSSTAVPRPPTPRSATTPSVRWPPTPSSAGGSARPV